MKKHSIPLRPFLEFAAWFRAITGPHIYIPAMAAWAFCSPVRAQTSHCQMTGLVFSEPICRVIFADLDNTSPGETTAPTHEDFYHLAGATVNRGGTYQLQVTGNTDGDYTTSVYAYFDWDQDGVFETALTVGTLTNTFCTASTSAWVQVPSTAATGYTRMRILKKYGSTPPSPNDGCTAGSSYGQSEDYSVYVREQYCPMPTFPYVEGICQVSFAGFNNANSDFESSTINMTDMWAQVNQGQSYTLSVAGHTEGNYANSIRAYFDWDGDGSFETALLVGVLTNDNCMQMASTTVAVPANASTGLGRMRIIKHYDTNTPQPNDGCTAPSPYGQTHDYSVYVHPGTFAGIEEQSIHKWDLFPNPSAVRSFHIMAAASIANATLEVRDLLGRIIHSSLLDLPQGGQHIVALDPSLDAGRYLVIINHPDGRDFRHWIVQ